MGEPIICDNNCKELAANHCRECHMFLCVGCLDQVHKKWKRFMSHEVSSICSMDASLLESLRNDVRPNCKVHRKPFDYYCKRCPQVMCLDCTIGHRRDHWPHPITDVFGTHLEDVEKSLIRIKERSEAIQQAQRVLNDRMDAVARSKDTVCEDICRHAQDIIESVSEARDQLVAQVNNATDHELRALGQVKDGADIAFLKLKNCEEHIRNFLKASKFEILLDKADKMEMMAKLYNEVDPNRFKPAEEVRLLFVKDREVTRRCQTIGQIEPYVLL